MKRILLFLLCMLTGMQSMKGAVKSEAYVEFTAEDSTLTFRYDNKRESRTGIVFDLNKVNITQGASSATHVFSDEPVWYSTKVSKLVKKVVIEPMFAANSWPSTTHKWFADMENLESIIGLEGLKTGAVLDMSYMFANTKLRELNLSNFIVWRVYSMFNMFSGCSNLESLDLGFSEEGNARFETLYMDCMFKDCSRLTSLDLSHFHFYRLENTTSMFMGCSSLEKIYVNTEWDVSGITSADSYNMFYGCSSLMGGSGTVYDENHVDALYAHIDGGTSNPGYLRLWKEEKAYVSFSALTSTLSFHYDRDYDNNMPGTTYYDLNSATYEKPMWVDDGTSRRVSSVVFDPSFAVVTPTTTFEWFFNMRLLNSIKGLQYLNTGQVTIMREMFSHCEMLKHLDLSLFDTQNVTDMAKMFQSCQAIKTLDLKSFDTGQVTNMEQMFAQCEELQFILVSDKWSRSSLSKSDGMFTDCKSLIGGSGTTYDAAHADGTYACIDGGTAAPGYLFTGEFAIWIGGERVTLSNRSKIPVIEGAATFNPELSALYLDHCLIAGKGAFNEVAMGYGAGIYSNFIGLKVYVTGPVNVYNTPGDDNTNGIFFNTKTTIYGNSADASLSAKGYNGIYSDTLDIGVVNGCYITVVAEGSNGGLVAKRDRRSRPQLTYIYNRPLSLNSANVTLKCKGSTISGISYWKEIGGDTSLRITSPDPNHTQWNPNQHMVCDTYGEGNPIVDEWIVIEIPKKPYALLANSTLTFYYDSQFSTRTDQVFDLNVDTEIPEWIYEKFDKVVFNESFANARPTTTFGWFIAHPQLTFVNMQYLNTSEVTRMDGMFQECEQLTELDLTNFDTRKVTNMSYMFYKSKDLVTIYVGANWNTESVTESEKMFWGCPRIVGAEGTKYTSSHLDVSYAHVDGGPDNPGYLSLKPYVMIANGTLTFYNDGQRWSRPGTSFELNVGDRDPGWFTYYVNSVVFDASFASARPTSTYEWFAIKRSLESIENLQNLNTSEVTNMYGMFEECVLLTDLDLSGFDTRKVTQMSWMFADCKNLKTIYVGDEWSTENVETSVGMFNYCNSLVGEKGTTFDKAHTDASYAHIDGGADNPGYLTLKVGYQLGDVNLDGKVGIGDIVAITNVMAGIETDPGIKKRANVNNDAGVGIGDIVAITNIMAGIVK